MDAIICSILRATVPLFKKNRTNTYRKYEPKPLSQKKARHTQLEQLQVRTLLESDYYDEPNHNMSSKKNLLNQRWDPMSLKEKMREWRNAQRG